MSPLQHQVNGETIWPSDRLPNNCLPNNEDYDYDDDDDDDDGGGGCCGGDHAHHDYQPVTSIHACSFYPWQSPPV